MPHFFISYSRKNREIANYIKDWLVSHDFTTFIDHESIRVGDDWEKILHNELRKSQALILILTPKWYKSKWCFAEYQQARALGKTIYPLVLKKAKKYPKPPRISGSIQHLDISDINLKIHKILDNKLLTEIKKLVMSAQNGFEWDNNRSPYPGLLSFEEKDAAIFFGREKETNDIIEKLSAQRTQGSTNLLILMGASGSGKSSLLKAGVLPHLHRDKENWIPLPAFRPGSQPVYELAKFIASKLDQLKNISIFYDQLMEASKNDFLSDIANKIQNHEKQLNAKILISIDQSEELFSTTESKEAQQFFQIISQLNTKNSPWLFIFTLRSDFLEHLQKNNKQLSHHKLSSITPVKLSKLHSIIKKPADLVGFDIEEELIDVIKEDAKTHDALPIIAFALRRLYEICKKDKKLTLNAYLNLKKNENSPLESIVAEVANDTINEMDEKSLEYLRKAFIPSMVSVNDKGDYVRRTAYWKDLPPEAFPLLEKLANARLLTIKSGDTDKNKIVEVCHEALLQKWPLLHKWLEDEHSFLVGKKRLEQSIYDWNKVDKDKKNDALLHGLQLSIAREWLDKNITPEEKEYIEKSIGYKEKQERNLEQELQKANFHLAKAYEEKALLAIINGRNESKTNGSQALTEYKKSWLYALEAMKLGKSSQPDTGNILKLTTLGRICHLSSKILCPERSIIPPPQNLGGSIQTIIFSPDSKRVVIILNLGSYQQNTIDIYDTETGAQVASFAGGKEDIEHTYFDGKKITLISRTNQGESLLQQWRTYSKSETSPLKELQQDTLKLLSFSPINNLIAIYSKKKTIINITTLDNNVLLPIPLKDNVSLLRLPYFSPDGEILALTFISNDNSNAYIELWDLKTKSLYDTVKGFTGWVYYQNFSSNSKTLIISESKKLVLWDIQKKQSFFTVSGKFNNRTLVAYNQKKQEIAYFQGNILYIWDTQRKISIVEKDIHIQNISSLAYNTDGSTLVVGTSNGRIHFFTNDLENLDPRKIEHCDKPTTINSCKLTFIPNSNLLNSQSNKMRINESHTYEPHLNKHIWNVKTGKRHHNLEKVILESSTLTFSSNKQCLATSNYANKIELWNSKTEELAQTLETELSMPEDALCYSSDGRVLFFSIYSSKYTLLQSYNLLSDEIKFYLCERYKLRSKNNYLLPSYYGYYIFSGNRNFIRICPFGQSKQIQIFTIDNNNPSLTTQFKIPFLGKINAIAYCHHNNLIAISINNKIECWEINNNSIEKQPKDIQLLEPVTALSFNHDGTLIAVGTEDISILILQTKSMKVVNRCEGHSDSVTALDISNDGSLLASASSDQTIRLWIVKSGGLKSTIKLEHHNIIKAIAFSPSSTEISTLSKGIIQNWNIETASIVSSKQINISNTIKDQRVRINDEYTRQTRQLLYNRDETILVSASSKFIYVWDIGSFQLKGVLDHNDHHLISSTLAFSSDGSKLACEVIDNNSQPNRNICLWDIKNCERIKILKDKKIKYHNQVNSLVFSNDKKYIYTITHDNKIQQWEIETGRPTKVYIIESGDGRIHIHKLFRSSNGKTYALATYKETNLAKKKMIQIWDINSNNLVQTLEWKSDGSNTPATQTVTCSSDGTLVASESRDSVIRLWHININPITRTFGEYKKAYYASNPSEFDKVNNTLSYSPNGLYLASINRSNSLIPNTDNYQRRGVELWDVQSGNVQTSIGNHYMGVNSICFHPRKHSLVYSPSTCNNPWVIKQWDINTQKESSLFEDAFPEDTYTISALAYKPSCSTLVALSNSASYPTTEDQTIFLLDLQSRSISKFHAPKDKTDDDGFISGSSWDSGQSSEMYFNTDGSLMATINTTSTPNAFSSHYSQSIFIWNSEKNKVIERIHDNTEGTKSIAFSHDGKLLAWASSDNNIYVRNIKSSKIQVLKGHTKSVNSISFHPKQLTLVSASDDKTIRIWDITNHRLEFSFIAHHGSINSVLYNPDGTEIASASDDESVKIWDVNSLELFYKYDPNLVSQSLKFLWEIELDENEFEIKTAARKPSLYPTNSYYFSDKQFIPLLESPQEGESKIDQLIRLLENLSTTCN